MVTHGDTVHLQNWKWIKHNYHPKKGIDVVFKKVPDTSNESYITMFGSERDNIYKDTINEELAKLEKKFIASDRVRTVNNLPKFKVINTIKERIQ